MLLSFYVGLCPFVWKVSEVSSEQVYRKGEPCGYTSVLPAYRPTLPIAFFHDLRYGAIKTLHIAAVLSAVLPHRLSHSAAKKCCDIAFSSNRYHFFRCRNSDSNFYAVCYCRDIITRQNRYPPIKSRSISEIM